MPDNYDVLPIAVNLGGIYDKEKNQIKPFVGIYFPTELLDKMNWTKKTRLTLSVEDDFLKIVEASPDREDYFIAGNELTYVPIDDE